MGQLRPNGTVRAVRVAVWVVYYNMMVRSGPIEGDRSASAVTLDDGMHGGKLQPRTKKKFRFDSIGCPHDCLERQKSSDSRSRSEHQSSVCGPTRRSCWWVDEVRIHVIYMRYFHPDHIDKYSPVSSSSFLTNITHHTSDAAIRPFH
jgi:hypothetical protein